MLFELLCETRGDKLEDLVIFIGVLIQEILRKIHRKSNHLYFREGRIRCWL